MKITKRKRPALWPSLDAYSYLTKLAKRRKVSVRILLDEIVAKLKSL